MPSPFLALTGRVLRRLWWLLDASRRALLNLMLLALVAAALWLVLRAGPPSLAPRTTLVLDIAGPVVEQHRGDLGDGALGALRLLRGRDEGATRLRDVVAALDAAAQDEDVTQALLLLDDLGAAGLPTLREIAAAVERFKAAGKPVLAWASSYDQRGYYLAAHASQAWMHPMGLIVVEGYGRWRNYYKELFDRIGVSAQVHRAGRYKNFAEVYSASAPSPESLQAEGALYASLWQSWTDGVEKVRGLPAGSVARAIASLPASLQAVGGSPARWALEQRWIDGLKTRDELRALLAERGAVDDGGRTLRQVALRDYLPRAERRLRQAAGEGVVAVVVAMGEIGDGRAPAGRIGGLSTAELVRRAREDDAIRALVLRVNSPGGSAFGSELVRRELELTRAAGKPVVVSMGDVAASGGYWISLAADEIIADEATVTGSIGVVALLPNAAGAMDKLGVHTGGVHTTWLGAAADPRRPFDPRLGTLVQTLVDRAYLDFTTLAAGARGRSREQIDAVGQGRVWSGRQALANGLVDANGGLHEAVAAAARRAGLGAAPQRRYVEVAPGRLQRWLQDLAPAVGAALGPAFDAIPSPALHPALNPGPGRGDAALRAMPGSVALQAAAMHDELAWLADVAAKRHPGAAIVHCLCTAP